MGMWLECIEHLQLCRHLGLGSLGVLKAPGFWGFMRIYLCFVAYWHGFWDV